MSEPLSIWTRSRKEVVDLTGEVGEGTEDDLLEVVETMIPPIDYRHAHNPSQAWSHMAGSILGPSLTIPISGGRLVLGSWQSVLLVELSTAYHWLLPVREQW